MLLRGSVGTRIRSSSFKVSSVATTEYGRRIPDHAVADQIFGLTPDDIVGVARERVSEAPNPLARRRRTPRDVVRRQKRAQMNRMPRC